MAKGLNNGGMSELETEFELEMDEGDEFRNGQELDEGLQEELEAEPSEEEFEEVLEELTNDYADRFYELAQRGFESETEVDEAVNELVNEMEREYFFGSLKKAFNKVSKNKLFRKALGVAKNLALKHPALQAIKGVTQLTRGNLKGFVGSLARAGIGAAIPGGAGGVILPAALQALGFKEAEYPQENKEAWNQYVDVVREAYDHLAQNLTDRVDEPLEASRVANNAFQTALRKVSQSSIVRSNGKRRVIALRRGDRILIKAL
jgi:hypothetical protein